MGTFYGFVLLIYSVRHMYVLVANMVACERQSVGLVEYIYADLMDSTDYIRGVSGGT